MKFFDQTKKYSVGSLELVVFICGAVVMVFELAGSRVLAPYLGTSIYIWTSLIGVILGSLSVGYWLGGKLADKKSEIWYLSLIILLAAAAIGITVIIKDKVLIFFPISTTNWQWISSLISLILFAPASILLGMVSPYALKLQLKDLAVSGRTAGSLYAISTVGSIVGTFFAGFYLIPHLGNTQILFLLAVILILTSIFVAPKSLIKTKIALLLFLVFFWCLTGLIRNITYQRLGFLDLDTQYNRIWIYQGVDLATGRPVINLATDKMFAQSVRFLDSDELVAEYAKYYRLAKHFNPKIEKSLMLGGGGYSYPQDYLKNFPLATIDVVEIDPKVTALARTYFGLEDNPRLKIYHEDGRLFLNQAEEKYDVIFGDVFNSFAAVPYQLATQEAIKREYEILNDGGVVIINIASALAGDHGRFLQAEYITYQSVFPQVYLLPVQAPQDSQQLQNIILVALKSNDLPSWQSTDPELNGYLQHLWVEPIADNLPVLVDNYAPVEYYQRSLFTNKD
ncbi:MAG: fused MFS/spermidine synthase [Patescibacteria group bacterium]